MDEETLSGDHLQAQYASFWILAHIGAGFIDNRQMSLLVPADVFVRKKCIFDELAENLTA